MTDMKLRDRAQMWLDKYKAGESCNGLLDIEDTTAIVAIYLHDSEEMDERVKALQDEIDKLRKENEGLRSNIRMLEREMDGMDGQIAAYKFVIRCNGVSGAEVH